MSNMSYCRFENTLSDLADCYNHINDENLSDSEETSRTDLIDLCRTILDEIDNNQ